MAYCKARVVKLGVLWILILALLFILFFNSCDIEIGQNVSKQQPWWLKILIWGKVSVNILHYVFNERIVIAYLFGTKHCNCKIVFVCKTADMYDDVQVNLSSFFPGWGPATRCSWLCQMERPSEVKMKKHASPWNIDIFF